MADPGKGSGGYANPPKHSRFKPGKSGNPSGKRKPPKVGDIIVKQLMKITTVSIEGKPTKMTFLEVMIAQLARKAAAGDLPAIKLFIAESNLLDEAGHASEPQMTAGQLEMLQQLIAAAAALGEDKS